MRHFLNFDYPAFLHIFVPRIEDLVRRILRALRFDMTTLRGGEIREKPFGELLREAERKNGFPDKYIELLRATFTEEWGWNLRNKLAHGWSTEEDCCESNAVRVLHIGLLLANLRITSQKEVQISEDTHD